MQHANYFLEPLVDAKRNTRKVSQRYVSEHLFGGGSVGIRRHSDEMLREPKFTLNVSTLSLLGKNERRLRNEKSNIKSLPEESRALTGIA